MNGIISTYMFIHSTKLRNFKCFKENEIEMCVPDGTKDGSGLNIFVGENNSGKSSLMEAVYFVRNKAKKPIKRIGAAETDDYFVEVTFVSDDFDPVIDHFVQDNKRDAFKGHVYEDSGKKFFKVKRLFTDEDEAKKILFFKNSDSTYTNPSGIDSPFQKFFQLSNIWSDTSPETESKYGASTVCGNLLSDISEKFKIDHKAQWDEFLRVFNETFNDNSGGLQSDLNILASETEAILNEQFGAARLRFKFDNPEPDLQFKNIKIFVNDGQETEITEKGHGMQRAVILSLLQVYAKRITALEKDDGTIVFKPHFLFIDEPEMGLHPQAQKKLFDALKIISKHHQVFISTHSENFISIDLIENVFKFQKVGDEITVKTGRQLNIDLRANRKFFLHHHKLFFAKNAIFVEGADDYERFPLHLKGTAHHNCAKDIAMLGSCERTGMFKKFCEHFGINSSFILDLDVIATNSSATASFEPAVRAKITTLSKTTPRKDPSPLFDANLNASEVTLKNGIITDLSASKIFVLKNGAIEHYLDAAGTCLNGHDAELETIFQAINSST